MDAPKNTIEHLKAVKHAHQQRLMRYPNVIGLAIGMREKGGEPTGELVLVVMVTQKLPREQLAPDEIIPTQIEGVRIDVQQVGEIRTHE